MADDKEDSGFNTIGGVVQTVKLSSMDTHISASLEGSRETLKDMLNLLTSLTNAILSTELSKPDESERGCTKTDTLEFLKSRFTELCSLYTKENLKFLRVSNSQAVSLLREKKRITRMIDALQ